MNYIKVIDEIFGQFDGQKFSIKFWNGEEHYYGVGSSVEFTLVINDSMTVKSLLAQGSIGFGESYMEGRLKIEGNIESYLKLRHQFKKTKHSLYLKIAAFLATRSVPRKRADQIAQHYDTGNSFFKMILDKKTMSYSSGKYDNNYVTLDVAQKNKLKFTCDVLRLAPGSSVLDLGSGWGGFALYAAQNYKWHVKGTTLSNAQFEYCKNLTLENKLEDLLSFEYFDMLTDFPKYEFDGIVMIESIEHIGQKNILPFFHNVKKIMKPGASFVIQSTVRQKIRSVDRWTLKYVFPGGYLPNKEELLDASKKADFIVEECTINNQDYIYTITEWIKNLEANKDIICAIYGEKFYRLWELWMYGTKVGFEMKSIGLLRLRLKKALL